MKILTNENLADQILEVGKLPFKITINRGKPVLEQTKRNLVRRDLVDGLYNLLSDALGDVANLYLVEDGVAIEIDNKEVYNALRPQLDENGGSGNITFTVDITIHDLTYDAYEQSENFLEDRAAKDKAAADRAARQADILARKAAGKKAE